MAFTVLRTLFDNLKELLDAHTTVQNIRLDEAFDEERLPRWVFLHPGSRAFTRWVDETLVIATGAITGTYYDLGKAIESLLEPHGIESLVIHTDGSIENVERLREGKPLLVIMQYDIALAARSSVVSVYGVDPSEVELPSIPAVAGIRRT